MRWRLPSDYPSANRAAYDEDVCPLGRAQVPGGQPPEVNLGNGQILIQILFHAPPVFLRMLSAMSEVERNTLRKLSADFVRRVRMKGLCSKYSLSEKQLVEHLLAGYQNRMLPEAQLARLLIQRQGVAFPSDAEDRLAALLASMNNGLKQALLLVADTTPRTYTELYQRLSSATSATLPRPQVVDSYCVDTFTPSGLFVTEWYGRRSGYQVRNFRLTPAGVRYGQPIAAYSMKYAVTHGISLYELLGQRQSAGGTIGPYNRVRILEILSRGQLRVADLARRVGLVIEDVRQHLRKMSSLQLLAYDSLSCESKGMKAYSWVDGRHPMEAKQVGEMSRLTRDVAKWLYLNKQGERNQIADALNYRHVTSISSVLVGLATQGLARTPFIPSGRSRILLLERDPG